MAEETTEETTTETPDTTQSGGEALTPEAIAQAVKGAQGGLEEALRDLAEKVESRGEDTTTDTPDRSDTPDKATPNDDADALVQRLLSDPKATITEMLSGEVEKTIAEKVGPALGQDFEARRDFLVDNHVKPAVDREYGDGFFDEHIKDRLIGKHGVLSRYPLVQQANPKIIQGAINGIIGTDMASPESRERLLKSLEKTTKERQATQPLETMGPGGPRPARSTLTPDMKDSIRRLRDEGVEINEDDISQVMNLTSGSQGRGVSLSEWQSVMAKTDKGGKTKEAR